MSIRHYTATWEEEYPFRPNLNRARVDYKAHFKYHPPPRCGAAKTVQRTHTTHNHTLHLTQRDAQGGASTSATSSVRRPGSSAFACTSRPGTAQLFGTRRSATSRSSSSSRPGSAHRLAMPQFDERPITVETLAARRTARQRGYDETVLSNDNSALRDGDADEWARQRDLMRRVGVHTAEQIADTDPRYRDVGMFPNSPTRRGFQPPRSMSAEQRAALHARQRKIQCGHAVHPREKGRGGVHPPLNHLARSTHSHTRTPTAATRAEYDEGNEGKPRTKRLAQLRAASARAGSPAHAPESMYFDNEVGSFVERHGQRQHRRQRADGQHWSSSDSSSRGGGGGGGGGGGHHGSWRESREVYYREEEGGRREEEERQQQELRCNSGAQQQSRKREALQAARGLWADEAPHGDSDSKSESTEGCGEINTLPKEKGARRRQRRHGGNAVAGGNEDGHGLAHYTTAALRDDRKRIEEEIARRRRELRNKEALRPDHAASGGTEGRVADTPHKRSALRTHWSVHDDQDDNDDRDHHDDRRQRRASSAGRNLDAQFNAFTAPPPLRPGEEPAVFGGTHFAAPHAAGPVHTAFPGDDRLQSGEYHEGAGFGGDAGRPPPQHLPGSGPPPSLDFSRNDGHYYYAPPLHQLGAEMEQRLSAAPSLHSSQQRHHSQPWAPPPPTQPHEYQALAQALTLHPPSASHSSLGAPQHGHSPGRQQVVITIDTPVGVVAHHNTTAESTSNYVDRFRNDAMAAGQGARLIDGCGGSFGARHITAAAPPTSPPRTVHGGNFVDSQHGTLRCESPYHFHHDRPLANPSGHREVLMAAVPDRIRSPGSPPAPAHVPSALQTNLSGHPAPPPPTSQHAVVANRYGWYESANRESVSTVNVGTPPRIASQYASDAEHPRPFGRDVTMQGSGEIGQQFLGQQPGLQGSPPRVADSPDISEYTARYQRRLPAFNAPSHHHGRKFEHGCPPRAPPVGQVLPLSASTPTDTSVADFPVHHYNTLH